MIFSSYHQICPDLSIVGLVRTYGLVIQYLGDVLLLNGPVLTPVWLLLWSLGFGFLSFESEESVDSVCQQQYVEVAGKKVKSHFTAFIYGITSFLEICHLLVYSVLNQ